MIAALSLALVGGCLVTSSVEFEEEANVPPVVMDTAEFQLGSIYEFDRLISRELRLAVTVRDENVSQKLLLRARVSVDPTATTAICPEIEIPPSGMPQRMAVPLTLTDSQIQRGACNMVEIFVSSKFYSDKCGDEQLSNLPDDQNDLASGVFWVWDLTGDPHLNPIRAQELLNSCQTKPPMSNTTAPATMMVPSQ